MTAEQFAAALALAYRRLGHRRRGWHAEADIAAQIGISRTTLRVYRRAYGFPRRGAFSDQSLTTFAPAFAIPSER